MGGNPSNVCVCVCVCGGGGDAFFPSKFWGQFSRHGVGVSYITNLSDKQTVVGCSCQSSTDKEGALRNAHSSIVEVHMSSQKLCIANHVLEVIKWLKLWPWFEKFVTEKDLWTNIWNVIEINISLCDIVGGLHTHRPQYLKDIMEEFHLDGCEDS